MVAPKSYREDSLAVFSPAAIPSATHSAGPITGQRYDFDSHRSEYYQVMDWGADGIKARDLSVQALVELV